MRKNLFYNYWLFYYQIYGTYFWKKVSKYLYAFVGRNYQLLTNYCQGNGIFNVLHNNEHDSLLWCFATSAFTGIVKLFTCSDIPGTVHYWKFHCPLSSWRVISSVLSTVKNTVELQKSSFSFKFLFCLLWSRAKLNRLPQTVLCRVQHHSLLLESASN